MQNNFELLRIKPARRFKLSPQLQLKVFFRSEKRSPSQMISATLNSKSRSAVRLSQLAESKYTKHQQFKVLRRTSDGSSVVSWPSLSFLSKKELQTFLFSPFVVCCVVVFYRFSLSSISLSFSRASSAISFFSAFLAVFSGARRGATRPTHTGCSGSFSHFLTQK